ncbi:MarR family transcriptional regulator [Actinomadura darangshiensis]|uniref:MarR family transcriptional regulator n=1 Tax=Actinomadura darangshiensis TaxID=705336 RepID=A0A4R5BHC4_9ACTN|nr:MarR family winged helix-turn-helix transcriptional regulator [Actinomadura darangshiensis]TDD84290.1 MarR family transcriptional regulator [Actinomadura darangshiensis]
MDEPRWLEPAEDRAWRGYRRLSLLLDRQVARDLAADSGLSEPDYDVLSNLSETPGARMRLTELAAHMRWSPSRLSHHVTRMQQRGLVTRHNSPADGRAAVIALTGEGLRTIEEAAPAHVESVRRHFIDLLTPEQVGVFAALADSVVAHLVEVESR